MIDLEKILSTQGFTEDFPEGVILHRSTFEELIQAVKMKIKHLEEENERLTKELELEKSGREAVEEALRRHSDKYGKRSVT